MFSSVVDVFGRPERASSLKSSLPSLNRLYHNWTGVQLLVDSPNKRYSQHFKSVCTFGLIFYTFDPFFRIEKNRRAHQNTTNFFICQKQTDNPKWLILASSTHIIDMCTYITEERRENRTHVTHDIRKRLLWAHLVHTYIIGHYYHAVRITT